MSTTRTARPVAVVAALLLVAGLAATTPAASQEADGTPADATPIEPAPDFRTAPTVGSGTYSVDIVSGERVWVSVLYTDGDPMSVSARLVDVDVDDSEELTLTRSIINQYFQVVASETSDIPTSSIDGPGDTNIFFLTFTLETTGRHGERHELEFTLDGFEAGGSREPCGADCTLDDDLEDAQAELADLEAEIAECGPACTSTTEELEARITDLQTRLDNENAAIAELCGGEPCDALPAESTVPWPLVALFSVVAVGAGAGLLITRRRRAEEGGQP